ncbi:MAG: AAA family ATPase [Candidatus Magasanikbacteria bacterium]|nr:AAA family ATPase [Candidatus Magasanikbacteria bacterium]
MSDEQQNYIKSVQVDLFSSIFKQKIEFKPGFNVIAGGNGTGKTQLLNHILSQRGGNNVEFFDNAKPKDIAAFSPKRNAQKVLIEQAQKIIRKDENARTSTLGTFLNQNIQDDNFQTIKSISEYLVLHAEDLVNKNTPKIDATTQSATSYTTILQKVFDYQITFTWDIENTKYQFSFKKAGFDLTPSQLSSGENALISLMFAIFYAKDSTKVYLIDEPEVHLNWQLEEKLFQFLDWFCDEHKKQIIIVTHSRACFIDPFLKKTQFLVWEDGKIIAKQKPNDGIQQALAGDLVKIIGGITTESKIAYVEDKSHKKILEKIKSLTGKSLEVSILNGGCGEVKKYSEVFKNLNVQNTYFLIDNDNNPIPSTDLSTKYSNLIQLNKYCIENYFLSEDTLSQIDLRTDKTKTVKELIKEAIKQVNSNPYFVVYKKLIENNIELESEILDKIDASKFIKTLSSNLGYTDVDTFFENIWKN